MVSFEDVRSWVPGPLDDCEGQLKSRSDALIGLSDELGSAAKPEGWVGGGAEAAASKRKQLADSMERLVAAMNAARTAMMAASDGVIGLQHLVKEADGLAQAHSFAIEATGTVVDQGVTGVPADQIASVQAEREKIKAELVDRVRQAIARADEIDNALADVLRRVQEGKVTDGGATSLAAAAAAGASQGVAKPGIPGPPPNPPVDPGAGKHGEDPWYTRADDLITKGFVQDAAVLADSWGWTNASKHLLHYLDNSGDDLTVNPDEIMRDVPKIRSHVDGMVTTEMQRIAAEAEATGEYGKPVQFSTGWQGEYVTPEDNKDWFYAMGGGQYAVTGVATVHPPDQPGGQPRVEMDYQAHVADRYNWDGGKSTEIGPLTVTDEQLAELHRAGVAQEFDMSGSTDTKHFSGTVPAPGQQPELPSPPDNRDGTRTDPGRAF